jgi:hypothetical protein
VDGNALVVNNTEMAGRRMKIDERLVVVVVRSAGINGRYSVCLAVGKREARKSKQQIKISEESKEIGKGKSKQKVGGGAENSHESFEQHHAETLI